MKHCVFSVVVLGLTLLGGCPRTASEGSPAPEPAAAAPEPAAAPAPSGATVIASGVITVAGEVPEAQALFVSVRSPGVPGPPLAAKKLSLGDFPMEFSISEADRPMVKGDVPESFELKVTLDIDGNPMAKSPGDLVGVVTATKGATDLSVALKVAE